MFSFVPLADLFCACRQVAFSGRCFPDTYSLALEIQSVASINFRASGEVRAIGSIRNVILGFSVLSPKVQSLIFKIMSHFGFLRFGFCL